LLKESVVVRGNAKALAAVNILSAFALPLMRHPTSFSRSDSSEDLSGAHFRKYGSSITAEPPFLTKSVIAPAVFFVAKVRYIEKGEHEFGWSRRDSSNVFRIAKNGWFAYFVFV